MVTFDKDKELARIEEKAAKERDNAEAKKLAISILPEGILNASEHIHTGIYKDVLASVSLKTETLEDAIALMETSNAIVSQVRAKGTFCSFLPADSERLTKRENAGAEIRGIQPWTLELSPLFQHHTARKLQWVAEYGAHRFKFECQIMQTAGLPNVWMDHTEHFGRPTNLYRRMDKFNGHTNYTQYAGGSNTDAGHVIVWFPLSDNTAAQDFAPWLMEVGK